MSASENLSPAKNEAEYDVNENTDNLKHRPQKYTVPASFILEGVGANDRQSVKFSDSNSEMIGGPNTGPQRIRDNIPNETFKHTRNESFRKYNRYGNINANENNPFEDRTILNNPYIGGFREGFRTNSKDDKILDIVLSIIVGILLIWIVYKIFFSKPTNETETKKNEEETIG